MAEQERAPDYPTKTANGEGQFPKESEEGNWKEKLDAGQTRAVHSQLWQTSKPQLFPPL